MPILSHSSGLELKEHIKQVIEAADFLLSLHSPVILPGEDKNLLYKIIRAHDLGKGNSFFQEYIKDPGNYKGAAHLKSHSLLSSLITALKLIKTGDWKELFAALQAITGHHTQLRTLEELTEIWDDDDNNYTLKKQLNGYPFEEMSRLSGISLADIGISNNDPSAAVSQYIEENVEDLIEEQSEVDAIRFRLKTQFLYSILLEADKAFLAVPDITKHVDLKRHDWNPRWIDIILGTPSRTKVNKLRRQVRREVIKNANIDTGIYSLTSPTGSGKTLLAANWAFIQKRKMAVSSGINPKIIVVLPFLSIIYQTVKEYEKILNASDSKIDGSWLLPSHSLSDRHYSDMLEKNEESFFIDTWRSDVIITTYDRFLYAVMNPKSSHQLRFHNLMDSIIIMDEVQSLPAKLWVPLGKILESMTAISSTKILLMSATLPAFIENTIPLLPGYKTLFPQFNRYNLIVKDVSSNYIQSLQTFIEQLLKDIPGWIKNRERVLITLNTRRSAQNVFTGISFYLKNNNLEYPIYFISSDVIPLDRLRKIDKIKSKKPCIVVSTQCIEAGVDIDMTRIIRDFAPLDSLIQVAGRCNRNGIEDSQKDVTIVQLASGNGQLFCEMIYNAVHLEKTRQVLSTFSSIYERDVLGVTEKYFDLLMGRDGVDTGKQLVKQFAYWQEYESIKTILRGENIDKYELCLLERDLELIEIIKGIDAVENRWERREEWRRISGRLAQITISILARKNIDISTLAEDFHGIWNLNPAYYSDDIGFRLPDEDNSTWIL